MPKVAIAGWGYNGGQVIFKFQLGRDNRLNPTIYEEVAENCACCCLPPPRVKISLVPGTITGGITPGPEFSPAQRDAYQAAVPDKIEDKLSFTLDNIPCPQRGKWIYYYTFTPENSQYLCSIYLEVPRCATYQDLVLVCAAGAIDDATNPDPGVFPPPLRLPLTGLPPGPPAFIDWFRFIGFDDADNSGFPEVQMCVENICKLYEVNQRSFKIPCYRYAELGATGNVKNGVPNSVFDWAFNAASDGGGNGGPLAYFEVEFPGDQPLP